MPRSATTYASSSSSSDDSLPWHPRSLEVEPDMQVMRLARRSKTRSASKKQVAARPSILERRYTGKEVILEPNSTRPEEIMVIGRNKKNTQVLLGVKEPFDENTYIVHRDGRKDLKTSVPVYRLSHIREGKKIPKAVKYGRMLNMVFGNGDINKDGLDGSASSSSLSNGSLSSDDGKKHQSLHSRDVTGYISDGSATSLSSGDKQHHRRKLRE